MAEAPTALNYEGNAAAVGLAANGNTVTIGPLTVTLAGYDLTGSQAQCQLGRGANVPSGTTDSGFTDTTYALTAAQVQAGSIMGA